MLNFTEIDTWKNNIKKHKTEDSFIKYINMNWRNITFSIESSISSEQNLEPKRTATFLNRF